MVFFYRAIWVAAVFASSGSAFAEEWSPAHFGSAREEFLSRLELPTLADGANLIVRCVGKVSRRGALTRILCYDNPEDRENARLAGDAIRSAIRGLNLEPATVEGRTKTIGFSFAVAFLQTGETQQVQLMANHLYNAQIVADLGGAQAVNGGSLATAQVTVTHTGAEPSIVLGDALRVTFVAGDTVYGEDANCAGSGDGFFDPTVEIARGDSSAFVYICREIDPDDGDGLLLRIESLASGDDWWFSLG